MGVADEEFRHPRLAALYDALDPDRRDLDPYVDLAEELDAHRLLDVGCGTGTLALLLAERGLDVVGVDPAAASLAVARAGTGAARVHRVEGDATAVVARDRDLAVLTGNAAQGIWDDRSWSLTLGAVRAALRPGGHLALETRDPEARAWEGWTRHATSRTHEPSGVGRVTSWVEVTAVEAPLVAIRWTWAFAEDDATLTSTSVLRFRTGAELEADLQRSGLVVLDVRGAPDRPGLELVVLSRRPG